MKLNKCPNPACGSDKLDIAESINVEPLEIQYYCIACKMAGPVALNNVMAADRWNALPQPLRWTKELPGDAKGLCLIRHRTAGAGLIDIRDGFCYSIEPPTRNGTIEFLNRYHQFEFAPIPEPTERPK